MIIIKLIIWMLHRHPKYDSRYQITTSTLINMVLNILNAFVVKDNKKRRYQSQHLNT
ncbi:hypothetical protein C1645_778319 [Glomus cerebriforme]|uniref:Uncharacterized protein n=1 Tax=Glomus cerebriforme TaxID=658196 RepID=A0A397SMS9_9GLOM|nr:hypothetical protein C1645_778319 [Glomus cerebriforme]